MNLLLVLFLSVRLTHSEFDQNAQILEQSYDRITYQAATGKYAISSYVSSNNILSSRFGYTGTPGKSGTTSLSNIFSDNNNYWASKETNTATFHSNITISFYNPTTVEAFLIEGISGDKDNDGNTDYHGFPTKIKVYTATNDGELELHSVFVGTPVEPLVVAQFVFSKPVTCSKLFLEICDVTPDNLYSNGAHVAMIKKLKLIERPDHYELSYSSLSGDYDDTDYVNLHKVQIKPENINSTGERTGYSIDKAIDGNVNDYWASNAPISTSFNPAIFINFTGPILLEGLLIGAYFADSGLVFKSRTFYGYPKNIKLYVSNGNDEDYKLHAIFTGSPSGNSNEYFQFILYEYVKCSRIKIEFIDVTSESKITSGTKTPVISDIKILQNIYVDDDSIPFEIVTGNYANSEVVNFLKIPVNSSDSTAYKGTYLPKNAFDDKTNSYWVSNLPNDDTFHSCLYANFSQPYLLEAFLFDAAYDSNYWGEVTSYSGFPLKLKIHTALDDEDFILTATFAGIPEDPLTRAQFVLPNPINCTRVKLEFVDVTANSKFASNKRNACTAGIVFLKKDDYEYLSYHKISSYDDSHKLSSSMFKYDSTGSKSDNPISNAFDGKKDTFWISQYSNNDTFQSSIYINFTEPVLLEGFLISSYYTYSYVWGYKYGYGFPTKLKVYTSLSEDEPLKINSIFTGSADDSTYQFQLKKQIPCSRVKLEFYEVQDDNNKQKVAAVSEITVIAEIIKLPGTGDDDDKDYHTQHVNGSYPHNNVHDINFTDFTLPLGDDYLFIVEKKFNFENVEFAPKTKLSAIKNNLTNSVTVKRCLFTNCSVRSENGNGGAILSVNACLDCELSNFYNCSSKTGGGGGGIFIVLNNPVDEVTISKCNFENCEALFGSGIYAFSELDVNSIVIVNCVFTENSLLPEKENALTGGSAIYLQTKRAVTKRCKFYKNKGENSIKIDNEFDNPATPRIKELFLGSPVQINDCVFEIDQKSTSSISYIRSEKKAVSVDIQNCIFTGELAKNAHHISVESLSKNIESPKIHIKSCKFSSNHKSAINLDFNDLSHQLASFNVKNQVFNYNGENESGNLKSQIKLNFSLTAKVVLVIAIVAVIAIVLIIIKKNVNKENEKSENEDEDDQHDLIDETRL